MATSSSGSIAATTVNGTTRMTGLSSGLDVDSLVKQSVAAETTKVNKLKQQKQKAEWIQEAYRDITDDIQAFADKYFSVSSTSSIMNRQTFQAFAVSSSSTAVSADYTGDAVAGTHTVKVTQLATAAAKSTTGKLSKDITGTTAAASINYAALANTSFKMTIDGASYTVKLDSTVTDATKLQAAIDSAVGSNKVTVDTSSGYLKISAATNSGVQKITVNDPASSSSNPVTSSLSILGLTNKQSNRISTQSTLATLATSVNGGFSFDSHDQVELTINGTNFSFDKDTTLAEMISEVNNSTTAGVTMKYDEISDKLIMTAAKTGAGTTLTVSETGSTFLSAALGTDTAGQDAKLTVDNVDFTRSSNTVTISGIIYTLNKETPAGTPATINVAQDADTIYKNISNFVDDYNALINTINTKLVEEYDDDYPPLTDDQKKDMSDDEIKNWEKKAKAGLLASDSTLSSFVGNMREVLSEAISGVSLSSIGIEPGDRKYKEKGKLYIDEDKLKSAIKNNPEGVLNLFTKQSTDFPGTNMRKLTASQRTTRYKQEGIAYRLYDILQDNISTLGDSHGNKGLLLEKAGIKNDTTDTDNALSDQIKDLKTRIEKEEKHLDSEEDRLYKKYTQLEKYINKMNNQLSQISAITSQ